jgi:ribonuclease VapC
VILDGSAVVAVLQEEVGHEELEQKMREADTLAIGAPTLLETAIVVVRQSGDSGRAAVARFRAALDVVVIPFGEGHWEAATQAFMRFGKGRHPAALNFGDCMTYATATIAQQPLLCTGKDFAQTDIERA